MLVDFVSKHFKAHTVSTSVDDPKWNTFTLNSQGVDVSDIELVSCGQSVKEAHALGHISVFAESFISPVIDKVATFGPPPAVQKFRFKIIAIHVP